MSTYEVRPFSDWTQNNPYVGRGIVAGKIAVLAEGDAANRDDIKFLAPLPLFNADGSVKG